MLCQVAISKTDDERLAMALLEHARLPTAPPLPHGGIDRVLGAAREEEARVLEAAEVNKEVLAVDVAAGGFLAQWSSRMASLDGELERLGASLGSSGALLGARLDSLAGTMGYLEKKTASLHRARAGGSDAAAPASLPPEPPAASGSAPGSSAMHAAGPSGEQGGATVHRGGAPPLASKGTIARL
jgi:hypothetical protein